MAKNIAFGKYQGLGNDFVLIDDRSNRLNLKTEDIKLLAHRQYGVGCDQLMVVKKPAREDFRMALFNNDGSTAEMCGNGIRCFHRFLIDRGITTQKALSIETGAGIIRTRLAGKLVEVDMGEPVLEGADIPMNLSGRVVNHKLATATGVFNITAVSMGNPHIVIFVKDAGSVDIGSVGPALEHHPIFPKRTNVHFAQVDDRHNITANHWERGAGATLACGTGACATAVAAALNGLADRNVTIHQRGGDLKVRWEEKNNRIYMTGPAVHVFSGSIRI